MRETIRTYYSLTKPGVLYGNALTAAAGFLLASRGRVDGWLFLALVAGTTLVIASACVINNYLDQDIDRLMERTKNRALVAGKLPGWKALIFGVTLGLLGILTLSLYTNWLVVAIGLIGFIVYVLLYGALSKRLSIHGTLVGSISGATPILAGYAAVSGTIDAGAVIVFAMVFLWQMPEFYSISVYRRDEYKAAGVPVISVVRGIENTKRQILTYTIAYVITTLLLTPFGYTGITYFAVMAILGAYWIWLGIKGLSTADDNKWARQMFRFSLVSILVLCLMVSIGPLLP